LARRTILHPVTRRPPRNHENWRGDLLCDRDRQVALFPAPRRPDLASDLLAKLFDECRVLLAQYREPCLERLDRLVSTKVIVSFREVRRPSFSTTSTSISFTPSVRGSSP